jgi:hypothetical protein
MVMDIYQQEYHGTKAYLVMDGRNKNQRWKNKRKKATRMKKIYTLDFSLNSVNACCFWNMTLLVFSQYMFHVYFIKCY